MQPVQPAAAAGAAPAAQRGFDWKSFLFRMVLIYLATQWLFGSKTVNTASEKDPISGKLLPPISNMWATGEKFDLRVYLSTEPHFRFDSDPVWVERGLTYDFRDSNDRSVFLPDVPVPKSVQNNATYFLHIVATKDGFSPDPSASNYDSHAVVARSHPLTVYGPKPKVKVEKNLITGETPAAIDVPQVVTDAPTETISFWKPNLTLSMICDYTAYKRNGVPQQIASALQVDAHASQYWPLLFANEFWLLKEHLVPVNSTTPSLPLDLSFQSIGMTKWMFYEQMKQSLQMQLSMGSTDSEIDELKRMLLETNPYLLGVTMFVSILHMVFDFLAFKNDIQFWRNNKSLEGLSVKTIMLNVVCQFVVFLYLLDNDTSWMILFSVGIGLVIEVWKMRKAVKISFVWKGPLPWLKFEDMHSYKSKTKEYDDQAMRYLGYIMFPCLIGYAIYSLLYDTHRSWYSFILTALTGAVHMFGFIMMTPQLFINYRLKSVAHLPWKAFMYKALNTFIDDLFAFVIKMPTLHRLSCFRDDIIFVIYLIQRWIYRVDKSRVNEFGQSGEPATAADDATAAIAAAGTGAPQASAETAATADSKTKSD